MGGHDDFLRAACSDQIFAPEHWHNERLQKKSTFPDLFPISVHRQIVDNVSRQFGGSTKCFWQIVCIYTYYITTLKCLVSNLFWIRVQIPWRCCLNSAKELRLCIWSAKEILKVKRKAATEGAALAMTFAR